MICFTGKHANFAKKIIKCNVLFSFWVATPTFETVTSPSRAIIAELVAGFLVVLFLLSKTRKIMLAKNALWVATPTF